MSESARDSLGSLNEVYAVVVAGMRSRGAEVVQAIQASIPALVPELAVDHDAEYQAGRVATIAATIEYSLEAIERGGEWRPIPQALAAQARRAAAIGVRPGMLVRSYLTGHGRFMDFIVDEIKRSGYAAPEVVVEHLRTTYRSLLDHIVASVEHEYEQESERLARSPEQRRTKLVQRLLVEDVDPAELEELDYDVLSSWHLGVIATGPDGGETLRRLKTARGRKLLSVSGDDGTVWAWLGGPTKLPVAEFKLLLSANGYLDVSLAIGEPGGGLAGWRETHEEARAALPIARNEPRGLVRCADALPVVGALQSKAIVTMFHRTYLVPLNQMYLLGQPAREVLRAYFRHGRSPSTAGRAIGVSRRTIEKYLADVRTVLGDQLNLTGLEIALRLEELGCMADVDDHTPFRAAPKTPSALDR